VINHERPDSKAIERLPIDRLNAMSDGILAIVITILVLGIDIPTEHKFSEEGLVSFLIKLEPSLIAYAMSFVMVGIYWVQHAALFRFLGHANRRLIWLNILFLLPITLIPFIAKVKAAYRYDPMVIALFSSVHILCGVFLLAIWAYMLAHPELLTCPVHSNVKRSMTLRILVSPVICLIAMGLAFVDVKLGTSIFAVIPFFYIWHRTVDASIQKTEPTSGH
jgi:uncharacterized membrane protein